MILEITAKNPLTRIIRYVLSSALIYGAYTETGKWTAISLFLITVALELNALMWNSTLEE